MNYKIRYIILCLIILFFITITPIIILYSFGYNFDWQERKFVLTGGLYVESIPKKATVYINNKPQKETPAFIKRLLPKYYQIKVVKEGFHEWRKKIEIKSKTVAEVKNIILIPINPKIKIINEKISDDFSLEEYISKEKSISKNIFYIHKPSYILYKTDKNNSFQEQISLTPLPENQEYKIIVSGEEDIIILSESNQLFILNKKTRNFEILENNIQEAQFSYNNKKILYHTFNEIWIYYLKDQGDKKTGESELITRLSSEIKQAIWHPSNEHIIFLVNKKIKIIELDSRDERNIVDIIEIDAQKIAYSEKDKLLYLIKDKRLIGISLE